MHNNGYGKSMKAAYIGLVLLLSLLVSGIAIAQDSPGHIHLVHVMETDKNDLENPVGVVYSLRANAFRVIEVQGEEAASAGETVIKNISVFGRQAGSIQLKVGVEDPINIAVDNKVGRLLIYQGKALQLIEVSENASGQLNPHTLVIHEAGYLGIQVPQGMAFDAVNGELYILDAVGPQLVRIGLPADNSSAGVVMGVMDLSWADNTGLRGIAYDPETGNFQSICPGEGKLYEFNRQGQKLAVRDLAEFNLAAPQGILFAPSGDQTDGATQLSLYLADSGSTAVGQTGSSTRSNGTATHSHGKLIEFSLDQPVMLSEPTFNSVLVRTTNMAAYSPPSPDPSGLTYLNPSNTLLMSDGEVEETVSGRTHFMGANIWEVHLDGSVVRTANISPVEPTNVPMSDEPTGVTWNPGNGHYYFSDDNVVGVFDLNPGIDGLVGTADDSWTSFSTAGTGDGDPEGIAYDTWSDKLFVVDGINREIYQYTLAGNPINHFDVAVYGITDPESVEFNPINDTLFVIGSNRMIAEVTTSGSLIRTIDATASAAIAPAGLAYAPASDGSGSKRFYIVDRGIDNNENPDVIDGKMYEMTAPVPTTPGNTPPSVNAGADQSIPFGDTAYLSGSVTDDGLPNPPGTITTNWSVVIGPGNIAFGDPNALSTTANFSATGTYVIQLTASDGELISYDQVNIYITGSSGSTVAESRVINGNDDAEETSTGSVSLSSSDLELVTDASVQTVGIRFNGLNIPNNAVVEGAFVQFQVDETGSQATSLTIWGEAQDNPATFTSANFNVSSRLRTAASISWNPPAWTVVGQAGTDQRTPNLASIIQEIVNRPSWSSGNSIVIIINGSGRRTASAYEGSRTGAPLLHIEYSLPASNTPTPTSTATATPSPTQTASITPTSTATTTPSPTQTASITPTPTNTATATVGPSPTASPTASPSSTATNTPTPSQTATFTPTATGSPTPTSTNTFTTTPSPTNTLTPVPSSTPTNTPQPTFTFTPSPTYTPTNTPLPTSTFTPTPTRTPTGPLTLEDRVSSSSDDAEESSTGAVNFTDLYLELVYDSSNQVVGIRFRNLRLPQGAQILNAYVQFEASGINTEATSLTIRGQASDNASSFSRSKRNVSSRARTISFVEWSPAAWSVPNEAGLNQRTPDISTIVQEIINRPGWSSGNSLVVLFMGSGVRTAWSYNGLSTGAPILHIEYMIP